jgi:ribosome biogenesis protein ERB1
MPQRAGQKRKVVEVPRPDSDEEDVLGNAELDGAFDQDDSDDGSEDEFDSEEGLEDDGEDEEELDSDEIPSEDEGEEDIRQQMRNLKTNGEQATSAKLMGSDTGKEIQAVTPDEPMKRFIERETNYRVEKDANGNDRYIYGEIDPAYDTDDSDAPVTTNTIGDIPLKYYDAYPHIGYDINGKKIARPAKGEALDSLLESIDLPEGWTGLTDPATGKPLKLSKEELQTLKQLTRNEQPGDGYDPYPDYVEWFTGKGMEEIMPLSAAPEPKRRFIPSMHEHKRVMKMVKAIKEGRIKPYKSPEEEEQERAEAEADHATYDVWANEAPRPDHPMNVPAPKLPPPGYEESYHPPPEYLPDKTEREAWEKADEEDRDRDFLPQDHAALRKVPGYARLTYERFTRCLDLYLAPRVRRSKLNIDPESLLPKLPDPSELKPFPTNCHKTMTGHEGRVRTVSVDGSGRWVASGGDDGTVRVWDLESSRQEWRIRLSSEEPVNAVSWRPGQNSAILAACCGETVYLMVPQIPAFDESYEAHANDLIDSGFGYAAGKPAKTVDGKDKSKYAVWGRASTSLQSKGVMLTLTLRSTPKTLVWHRRGEYFSTVCPSSASTSTAIAIHTLSKHQTQHPFRRLKGLAQTVCFHPSRPLFFVATRQRIRVYDLQQQKLEKELQPGARWISGISLHPMGENLLVSSYDKRLLWHDLDLGSTPYKTLRYHSKAIRSVKFHSSYPLFADASDDGTLQVFHGKVVTDTMENATIVPLKVLKGHKIKSDLGVLDVEWHPTEAWLVSGGADGTVRLWT